jgi:hypothetical protein
MPLYEFATSLSMDDAELPNYAVSSAISEMRPTASSIQPM